jgi:hypothetical protein
LVIRFVIVAMVIPPFLFAASGYCFPLAAKGSQTNGEKSS